MRGDRVKCVGLHRIQGAAQNEHEPHLWYVNDTDEA